MGEREVKVIKFKNDKGDWSTILIDSVWLAQKAVNDIIGASISEMNLDPHSLYDKKSKFIDFVTAKQAFHNLRNTVINGEYVVMNSKGGYIPLENAPWEMVASKTFKIKYDDNLRVLLDHCNGKAPNFVEI